MPRKRVTTGSSFFARAFGVKFGSMSARRTTDSSTSSSDRTTPGALAPIVATADLVDAWWNIDGARVSVVVRDQVSMVVAVMATFHGIDAGAVEHTRHGRCNRITRAAGPELLIPAFFVLLPLVEHALSRLGKLRA